MKAILHQVQRIFVGFLFAKQLVNQSVKGADKEEMMFPFLRNLLERMFQSSLQERNRHGRRHMEHFAASGNLAIVTVIREFACGKRFSVVNAARIFANRVLHILGKQGLEPEFAGLVGQVAAESHGLVAREKRRIALRANAQVQMLELDLCHL